MLHHKNVRPLEISQTVSALASVDFSGLSALLLSPTQTQRTLLDCPDSSFFFRPFLLPLAPGEADDYILSPMRADTAPMAHMICVLLEESA